METGNAVHNESTTDFIFGSRRICIGIIFISVSKFVFLCGGAIHQVDTSSVNSIVCGRRLEVDAGSEWRRAVNLKSPAEFQMGHARLTESQMQCFIFSSIDLLTSIVYAHAFCMFV